MHQHCTEYLSLEDKMFALPVLEHAERLQRTDDVVGIDCCFLANICSQEKQQTPLFMRFKPCEKVSSTYQTPVNNQYNQGCDGFRHFF